MRTNFRSPWIAVIVGVLALVFGIYLHFSTKAFMEDAVETTGTVIEIYEKKPKSNMNNRNVSSELKYCPIIEFVTEAGDTVEFKSTFGSTDKNYYEEGDDIDVLYDPSNPVKAQQKTKSSNMKTLVPIGMGIVFILMGLFIIIKKRKAKA